MVDPLNKVYSVVGSLPHAHTTSPDRSLLSRVWSYLFRVFLFLVHLVVMVLVLVKVFELPMISSSLKMSNLGLWLLAMKGSVVISCLHVLSKHQSLVSISSCECLCKCAILL